MIRDAYGEAMMVSTEAFSRFESLVDRNDADGLDARIKVVYKNDNNWRNVIYRDDEELFNLTVFTEEDLERVGYQVNSGMASTEKREELIYEDGRYIVHYKNIGGYRFYRLYDITDAYLKFRQYMLYFILISLGIIVVVVLITALVLRGILSPLSSLTDAASNMAEGDYTKRVTVSSTDEIGVLAGRFNEMAEAVEENSRRLTESEYKKTLMMGNLSHELKTPMTAIAGYAETLLTTKLSEDQKNEALYYIYSETSRLGRLSKKMMQLLSLSGGEVVEKKTIETKELLESISDTVSVRLKEKDIKLITESDSEFILTDEDLIKDVIINLVDNSIKASSPGKRVWVSIKENTLSVRDEGIGIPEEELSAVTEPFYMVDKSRSRKEGGAGLGLSIIKLIVEKLGGTLRISSKVNEGTEIMIDNCFFADREE
jgi:signal transduction histidine kinase